MPSSVSADVISGVWTYEWSRVHGPGLGLHTCDTELQSRWWRTTGFLSSADCLLISRTNQKGVRHHGYVTELHLQVICLSRCTRRASLWVRPSWTLPTVRAEAPGWTTGGPGLDGHQVPFSPRWDRSGVTLTSSWSV